MIAEDVYSGLIRIVPFLFGLTVHEYAHARVALHFGDPTARSMGRVSLNPLVHLDPLGTLSIILVGFGWAKPVPVNPANLHPYPLGDILVSFAGPASNLVLAVLSGILFKIMWSVPSTAPLMEGAAGDLVWYLFCANVMLFAFNMIPLFPLDGHHIARHLLPSRFRDGFMAWQMKHGRIVLMSLVIGPILANNYLHMNIPDPIRMGYEWIYDLGYFILNG